MGIDVGFLVVLPNCMQSNLNKVPPEIYHKKEKKKRKESIENKRKGARKVWYQKMEAHNSWYILFSLPSME